MTFLPIVERELRVRARLPATIAADRHGVGGAAVTGGLVSGARAIPGGSGGGVEIFSCSRRWRCFIVFFEGARSAADSLSEENGWVWAVFLTELRGYDRGAGQVCRHFVEFVLACWLSCRSCRCP